MEIELVYSLMIGQHEKVTPATRAIQISWTPPQPSYIKLNTDGASKGNLGDAAAAGLFRNHVEKFMMGFQMRLEIANNISVEL